MSKVKAFIVGVSKYDIEGYLNLPFCKNDILEMKKSLINGLKLDENDINTMGVSGEVNKNDFINELINLKKLVQDDDILIFYFSGHGYREENNHYLVFSDGILSTQSIIEYLEKIYAKSKVVFLDCCHSGEFSVDTTSRFNIEVAMSEFIGKGYAVFASSSASQYSYGHPDKPISVFTNFLSDAIQDKHLIRKGKITLDDIKKLVLLYLEIWNKKNPDKIQNPVFRANMTGTIFFNVEEYSPFYTSKIYEENDDYIIYNVELVHTGLAKRYSVKVILKDTFSLDEISKIAIEIKNKISIVEVYNNEISKNRMSGKLANIIWIYFGRDENDMVNSNFICRTLWVDNKQDKKYWYEVNNVNTFIINGTHFDIYSYYEQLRRITQENSSSKEEMIYKVREILKHLVPLAQEVICKYDEYINKAFSEEMLFEVMEALTPKISKYYLKSMDLGVPPNELHDWFQACLCLFGTIHDFTLFYNRKDKANRSKANRKQCMDMTIKRYNDDFKKLSEFKLI